MDNASEIDIADYLNAEADLARPDTAPLAQEHDARIAAEAVAPWRGMTDRLLTALVSQVQSRGGFYDWNTLIEAARSLLTQADKPAAVHGTTAPEALVKVASHHGGLAHESTAGFLSPLAKPAAVTERKENES